METLQNLIALYIGILVFNMILSAVLWWRDRSPLYGLLFFVWASSFASAAAQGKLSQTDAQLILGFSSTYLNTWVLSRLISGLTELPFRPKWHHVSVATAAVLGAYVASLDIVPFWVAALPTSVAVAAPLLFMLWRAWRATPEVSITVGAMYLTCTLFGLHMLDFPFVRKIEAFAPFGFTIGLLILFGLSITAPAVILERLTVERTQLKEIDGLKNRFFANISHELRTPLTVILASIDDLIQRVGAQDAKNQLVVARRNASRQLTMIDELLDLAKLDAGGLRLNVGPLSLESMVRELVENHVPLANAKSISLTMANLGGELGALFGDEARLETVLVNLLGNALKYTPDCGQIRVEVDGRGEDSVSVAVRDSGPGIPEEDLPFVFDRFKQVNRKDQKKIGGVGIGLSLARELAELHGGTLRVESTLGEGTSFILTLPRGEGHVAHASVERRKFMNPESIQGRRRGDDRLKAVEQRLSQTLDVMVADADDGLQSGSLEYAKVLVVEDQDELRAIIAQALEPFEVITAVDGQDGWEKFESLRPDLVVSDVMMPRMKGTELCRRIKADASYRSTPVILLTARLGSEATLEAYANGADDFVAKPFHPRVLKARAKAQLQLRNLSMQLVSQEKLASVGTLAAGMAHEIKNPINFILNAARMMQEDMSDEETNEELLAAIVEGAERIEFIVEALQSHGRPHGRHEEVSAYDLERAVDSTLQLLMHRTQDLEVHRQLEDTPEVWASAGPVNQVLLNLLDNAVRSGAKNIWVSGAPSSDMYRVLVEDDGPGVPADRQQRIFDAFFTTRQPGEGTGLGLYLSRKLVREQGGDLSYRDRSGGGAAFEITLPRAERTEASS